MAFIASVLKIPLKLDNKAQRILNPEVSSGGPPHPQTEYAIHIVVKAGNGTATNTKEGVLADKTIMLTSL